MRKGRGRKVCLLFIFVVFLSGGGWSVGPTSHTQTQCEPDGVQSSGAIYRICMPVEEEWNGDLVLFAHGYIPYDEPVAIPEDQISIPGVISIPEIVNDLGFAFAITSYSTNGLAVRQGLNDLVDLVSIFSATHGQPEHVYLVGVSEGGLITALAVERHPNVIDGGLAACGPVGNFRWQINYSGGVRVLFDYLFPGIIPGSPVEIPQEVIDNWNTIYEHRVRDALLSDPEGMEQLLLVSGVPTHPLVPDKDVDALVDLLWYNVIATNDGISKLGGQPFDNRLKYYRGSNDDIQLNLQVKRFAADLAAVIEMGRHYQTSGNIKIPIVTLHTWGDPITPFRHEPLYRLKITAWGKGKLHTNVPIQARYGHCNFTLAQATFAVDLLVRKVTGNPLQNIEKVLSTEQDRNEYRALMVLYNLPFNGNNQVYLPIVVH